MDIETKIDKLIDREESIEKARKIDVVKKHMEYCNNAKCGLKNDCAECTICFMLQNYNVTE